MMSFQVLAPEKNLFINAKWGLNNGKILCAIFVAIIIMLHTWCLEILFLTLFPLAFVQI